MGAIVREKQFLISSRAQKIQWQYGQTGQRADGLVEKFSCCRLGSPTEKGFETEASKPLMLFLAQGQGSWGQRHLYR